MLLDHNPSLGSQGVTLAKPVSSRSVEIYDTTLRDGAQTQGIQFSAQDKIAVANLLDEFEVDYIELGWPGANPTDNEVFKHFQQYPLKNASLVAFGATAKPGEEPENSRLMQSLIDAPVSVVTLVAKTSKFHIENILQTTIEENCRAIAASVDWCRRHGKRVWLDAEHFFDGYVEAPSVSLACLVAAIEAGAEGVTLCDTNGGRLPQEVKDVTQQMTDMFNTQFAIHAHNDCELAVANALAALQGGATVVQGCVNGYGERCGNTNLTSLMAILATKTDFTFAAQKNLFRLTEMSRTVSARANRTPDAYAPFVGSSAFAHKAGLHASAVQKFSDSYEHVAPEFVGNQRKILVSSQAGRSNLKHKISQFKLPNIDLANCLQLIKQRESLGFQYEEGDASLELLLLRQQPRYTPPFVIEELVENTLARRGKVSMHHASLKVKVGDCVEWTAAEGHGPVETIDKALRQALVKHWSELNQVDLADYKVRILNPECATAATTHVWIASQFNSELSHSIGCSESIFEASLQAICDSFEFFIVKQTNYLTSLNLTYEKGSNNGNKAA
ncbi:citramalate synthase [Pleionea litopenaei]|uniref:Citramalate synthase n=1 Tax=Pleionea litopenaei TaxID=3070815 RepID=A0AA51X7X1_9GAMM|nr:citramalate synthase [Pleionea sp. HL-JVS1]WMS88344.1 citramalate synthase [Pleionea sp. HL-JVS1]